jgi:hypothetical protein
MAFAKLAGSGKARRGIGVAVVAALLAAAVALRLWRLSTLPGINGDEAWYGVQMLNLMDGQAVDWRTPPGNLLNPFFSGLVLLVQWPFAPHLWILRAPAVISTLLAVVAGATLWRFLPTALVWVATLLLAALPVTIAYGRFGWDSSQSVLAGVLLIYCLMRQRWILAGVCFVLGVWVHPTNIFLAPLAFVHLAYQRPFKSTTFALKSGLALAIVVAAKQLFVPATIPMTTASMLARVASIEAWQTFVVRFGRLFSGATSYTYIAGPMSAANHYLHDTVFWLLFISVTVLGMGGIFRSASRPQQAHIAGWTALIAGFFVVAGPDALAPHFERYALVLVAPTILTFVLLLGHATAQLKMQRHVLTLGAAVAALCLASFSTNYIHVLASTGSESHRTFRTSAREPKAAALDWIRARSAARPDCSETRIVVEDWWTFWPLRYLAYRDPSFSVVMTSTEIVESALGTMDACSYLVGFAGGPFENLIERSGTALVRRAFNDPLDRPILFVWNKRQP